MFEQPLTAISLIGMHDKHLYKNHLIFKSSYLPNSKTTIQSLKDEHSEHFKYSRCNTKSAMLARESVLWDMGCITNRRMFYRSI